ncbi:MAG: polymer-forming cytoskeletal protein [Bacteroidia bacterium]
MSMFGNNGKKQNSDALNARNHIAQGTTIKGTLVSSGGLRIDGHFEGDITAEGKLVIGEKGHVKGTITCNDSEIEGTINGIVHGKGLMYLKATANFEGELNYGQLKTDPGATINGKTLKIVEGQISKKVIPNANGQSKEKVAAKAS